MHISADNWQLFGFLGGITAEYRHRGRVCLQNTPYLLVSCVSLALMEQILLFFPGKIDVWQKTRKIPERGRERLKHSAGDPMEEIFSLLVRLFEFVEWGWRNGGWWAVGGTVSLFVFIGLGIQRSPYR